MRAARLKKIIWVTKPTLIPHVPKRGFQEWFSSEKDISMFCDHAGILISNKILPMMILCLISSRIFCWVANLLKSLFLIKTIQFAKDVDAALMRPDAALRADQTTIDFFETFSTISNLQNSSFLIKNNPFCQGCGRGPMRPSKWSECLFLAWVEWGPHEGRMRPENSEQICGRYINFRAIK